MDYNSSFEVAEGDAFRDYNIAEKIHESPHTVIYRAVRKSDLRPVIVKRPKKEALSILSVARYKHEYEIIKLLKDKYSPHVFAFEQSATSCGVVLEQIQGMTLEELIDSSVNFPIEYLIELAINIIAAIGGIHSHNVIHKNLCPSNIIINIENNEVKIIDFAIASYLPRENVSLKNPNKVEGSISYVSPEQTGCMNRRVDYRTDFYSFGIVLYELFTGHIPFVSYDSFDMLYQHVSKQPDSPEQSNAQIPEMVSKIILKLMSKRAEDRYQGAWGIKRDLEKCLAQYEEKGDVDEFKLGLEDIPCQLHIAENLYGRENEVAEVLAGYDKAESGIKECVFIAGPSGIGKTSIVREVHKPLLKKRGVYIAGKFDQYNTGKPLSAVSRAADEFVSYILEETEKRQLYWKNRIETELRGRIMIIYDLVPRISELVDVGNIEFIKGRVSQEEFQRAICDLFVAFCSEQQPLVLFLDDLQWADSASLSVIERLLNEVQLEYFLFIGAFRDSEVEQEHPLSLLLRNLKYNKVDYKMIKPRALSARDIASLVSESLKRPEQEVYDFAELILSKTAGNPFFVEKYIKSLYDDCLIRFDAVGGNWIWEQQKIKLTAVTDNIVGFIGSEINKLDEDVKKALTVAACIGDSFSLGMLVKILGQTVREVAYCVRQMSIQGLVVPNEEAGLSFDLLLTSHLPSEASDCDVRFKFSHDRIRQSAMNLLSHLELSNCHLKLGRYFLGKNNGADLEHNIFEVVNHFNYAQELICQDEDKKLLAELNLQAAKKSKFYASYRSGMEYAEHGLYFLSSKNCDRYSDTYFELYLTAYELSYLSNNREAMARYAELLEHSANTVIKKVKILEIDLMISNASTDRVKTLQIGLQALRLLGIKISPDPSKLKVYYEFSKIKIALQGRKIEDLAKLPFMENDKMSMALRIMTRIYTPATLMANNLIEVIASKAVQIMIKHGNCSFSTFGYCALGACLCGSLFEKFDEGNQFTQLGLSLARRIGNDESLAVALHSHGMFAEHWLRPIDECVAPMLESYRVAMDACSVHVAMTSCVSSVFMNFHAGKNIVSIMADCDYFIETAKNRHHLIFIEKANELKQVVENFVLEKTDPVSLEGNYFSEKSKMESIVVAKDRSELGYIYEFKIMLSYIFERHEEFIEIISAHEQYSAGRMATPRIPWFHFFAALSYGALLLDSENKQCRNYDVSKLSKNFLYHKQKIEKYAKYNSENGAPRALLLQAEWARYKQEGGKAIIKYSEALKSAGKSKILFDKAVIQENFGKYYLAKDNLKQASLYLQQSKQTYLNWGGEGKARAMDKKYIELFKRYPIRKSSQTVA